MVPIVEPEVLMERLAKRGRAYESTVESSYLEKLMSGYNRFFAHYDESPLLILDTSNVNFETNPDDFEQILAEVGGREEGATIFGYHVSDPSFYGVVEFDASGRAMSIEEKPDRPRSTWAVTGLYFYDGDVVDIAKSISPSPRGELEITAVNRAYLDHGDLHVVQMGRGLAWLDTGTFASLVEAGEFVRVLETRQRLKIGSPEDVAYEMGFISAAQLRELALPLLKSGYGQVLLDRAERGIAAGR